MIRSTVLLGSLAVALLAWTASASVASDAPHGAAAKAESHGGHAAGGGGGGDVLEWKQDLAIWTAVVFIVLFFVLWKFAWGPISDGLLKREQHVADQIKQAQDRNAEAQRLLGDYEKKLAASQDEVRAIIDQARRDADAAGREIVDKARDEAQRQQEKALREIEQATNAAMKELADRSATLAVDLAGKIVGARLNPQDHAAMIERAVARFPGDNANFN